MRTFELRVQGLPELAADRGEAAVAELLVRLETDGGILSPRYDAERQAIVFAMEAFREGAASPGFSRISEIVQAYGEEIEAPLSVAMINRTVE